MKDGFGTTVTADCGGIASRPSSGFSDVSETAAGRMQTKVNESITMAFVLRNCRGHNRAQRGAPERSFGSGSGGTGKTTEGGRARLDDDRVVAGNRCRVSYRSCV